MKQIKAGDITVHLSLKGLKNLPPTMRLNRVYNTQLGQVIGYDGTMISKIRQGKASLPADSVKRLLEAMPEQNGFLAMEIANKMVGITVPVIDGDRIMKEPLAMAIKTMPEVSQALESIQNTLDELTIPANDLTPDDYTDPKQCVGECYDAVLYLMNLIAWICRAYHLSMQKSFDERAKVWTEERIIK